MGQRRVVLILKGTKRIIITTKTQPLSCRVNVKWQITSSYPQLRYRTDDRLGYGRVWKSLDYGHCIKCDYKLTIVGFEELLFNLYFLTTSRSERLRLTAANFRLGRGWHMDGRVGEERADDLSLSCGTSHSFFLVGFSDFVITDTECDAVFSRPSSDSLATLERGFLAAGLFVKRFSIRHWLCWKVLQVFSPTRL